VEISDQLDADLDWRSFRLREIAYGDTTIDIPDNRSFYFGRIQMASGYVLEIDAGIDIATGLVHWALNTIDPGTGSSPIDPRIGFLPPNDSTGAGQGHVSFTISAKAASPAGTEITNKALIVFDSNDPIETNEVSNTVRSVYPDLVITSASGSSSNEAFIEGETIDISASIGNDGEDKAKQHTVAFFDGDPETGGAAIDTLQQVPELPAGGESTMRAQWIPRRTVGNHRIYVQDDPRNIVAESDETNNTRVLNLNIQPREFVTHLKTGVNLVALPLEATAAYNAKTLASLLSASMIIEYDSTGKFVPFIADVDSINNFQIKPIQGYVAIVTEDKSITFGGVTNLGSVGTHKGINFLSLPLQADSACTARDWGHELGANTVISYDFETGTFVPFILDFHSGNGFNIYGGRGYFAIADKDTSAHFSGKGWSGESDIPPMTVPPAVSQDASNSAPKTSVLGIIGSVFAKDGEHRVLQDGKVSISRGKSGVQLSAEIHKDKGLYSAAFVDLLNKSPISVGDQLVMLVTDSKGNEISDKIAYVITKDDIRKGYARVDLRTNVEIVPRVTNLAQNFPNPFNPQTIIRFDLARKGSVRLSVYNVAGQLIRTLVDEKAMNPGYYKWVWNGENGGHRLVASGVYFCRVETPGYSKTIKMVILR
jgi:hypothetical protein